MRTQQTITISLPPEMTKQVEKTRRAEHRTRSELIREALHTYVAFRRLPEEAPTAAERRAILRGGAAYARGDYVTLDERLREEAVARGPRRARTRIS